LRLRAVTQGQEVLHRPFDDAQAVILQMQIADDLLVQQAHGIAGGRVTKPRVELLRDGGTAGNAAAFKYSDFQAAARQIAGAGQAIVARPNDGHIVRVGHSR
jgi:hypothetical protein